MANATITESWLKNYKLPPGVDRARFWDDSARTAPGFGVIIGKRFATFVVQRRLNGTQRMETIGRWGHPGAGEDHSELWTVTRAREKALQIVGKMEQGIDPSPKLASDEKTLRDAFAAHVASLRKKVKGGKRSEATIATFEKSLVYLERYKLADKPITEITGEVLRELHEKIKRDAAPRANAKNEKGAPLANRVITNVGTAWATLNKQLEGKLGNWNPSNAVDKDSLVAKRAVLGVNKGADLADWYERVTGKTEDGKHRMKNPIQRDGLVFALFTGLRSEDVRTIRFEHVDEDEQTLELPDPKGGKQRAFKIPLSKTCLEIVERRREDNKRDLGGAADGGWLFPAVDANGDVGPISDLRQQVHETITKGDEKVTRHYRYPVEDVHTLRRTYLSIANDAGVSELDQHVLSNHAYGSHNLNATYIAQHIEHLARCQDTIEAAIKAKLSPSPKPSSTKTKRKLQSVPMSA